MENIEVEIFDFIKRFNTVSLCTISSSNYLKGMSVEAIREITQVKNNLLTLRLPPSFKATRVEVIVMPAEESMMSSEEALAGGRRKPSPKLKGTKIIGDIMSPAVPEEDWNALK